MQQQRLSVHPCELRLGRVLGNEPKMEGCAIFRWSGVLYKSNEWAVE